MIALYTGDTQIVKHVDEALNEHKFVCLEIYVEKNEVSNDAFNIKNTVLNVGGVSYEQVDGTFLTNHNYSLFTKLDVRFGSSSGYIVFEIPQGINLNDAELIINDTRISVETHQVLDAKINSNIPTEIDVMAGQWEIEHMIIQDYYQNDYSVENPYVIVDPYGISPLSALVMFETEHDAKVSIKVVGKDEYTHVMHDFDLYNTHHEIPIVGLYAGYENTVEITLYYKDGTSKTEKLNIITEELVKDEMLVDISVNYSNPENMQEGMTFLMPSYHDLIAVDANGDVRWRLNHSNIQICQRLQNGNIMIISKNFDGLYEIDLTGKIYNYFTSDSYIHHDIHEMPNGNILVTSNAEGSTEDKIVELDRQTGEIIWEVDLRDVLDKTRFNSSGDIDWIHVNSLWFDDNDSSIIISGRHQGVFKISYPEAELVWITTLPYELESFENEYLSPLNEEFKAPVAQHAAMVLDDQDGDPNTLDIMLFDNNVRVLEMPTYEQSEKYSTMVQYRINEKDMTIEEVWSFGQELGENYFASAVCDANLLDNGNSLGTFGTRTRLVESLDKQFNIGSVIEVDMSTNEIVFDIDIRLNNFSYLYRAERLPMYPDSWEFSLCAYEMDKKYDNRLHSQECDFVTVETLTESLFSWNSFDANMDLFLNEINIDFWQKMIGTKLENQVTSLVFQSEEVTKIIEIENYDYSKVRSSGLLSSVKNWVRDVDRSKIDVSISLDDLNENLPDGVYYIGILTETPWRQEYSQSDFYITIGDNQPEKVDYLTTQKQMENEINDTVAKGDFTIDEPLIIVNPFDTSPLTAIVYFETDKNGTTKVEIMGDYPITHEFDVLTKEHTLPIYGLYADKLNEVVVTFVDSSGNTVQSTLFIQTEKLPNDFQFMEITVGGEWDNELTFLSSRYVAAYDQNGDTRWYLDNQFISANVTMIEWLHNGNIAVFNPYMIRPLYYVTGFFEIDMLGRVHNEFLASGAHHDVVELENGDFMVACEGDRHTTEDYIVRIDRETGDVVEVYDFTEIAYDMGLFADETYAARTVLDRAAMMVGATDEAIQQAAVGVSTEDWFHNNAIYVDEENNKIIVSARQKDVVMQIDATTKEIDWILTDPSALWAENYQDKILVPIGENFEYSYGQHAVSKIENGDIIVYDNGNFRSKDPETALSPIDNYSRGVQYRIDQENMTIEQVFEYGKDRGNELYTPFIGDIDYLGEDHYLINFGGLIIDENGQRLDSAIELFANPDNVSGESIIVEVKGGEVVSEFRIFGGFYPNSYRVERNMLYNDTTNYVDLSVDADRLGLGFETEYIDLGSTSHQYLSNKYVINDVLDQGSRYAFNVDFDDDVMFIVLENDDDVRAYEMNSGDTIFVDKAGLHDGVYKIWIMDKDGGGEKTDYVIFVGDDEICTLTTKYLQNPVFYALFTIGIIGLGYIITKKIKYK